MGALTLEQKLGLVKWLDTALAGLRAELDEEARSWPAGARHEIMIGGRLAGWASMPKPSSSVPVTDRARLLAWAEENYPGEVESAVTIDASMLSEEAIADLRHLHPGAVTETLAIRDSFMQKVTRQLKSAGRFADPRTGDRVDVPGVEVKPGKSAPRVSLEDDAEEVIRQARMAGLLDLGDLLALPAGESS